MRFAFGVEQDVSRFNVAMKDSMLVRIMNSAGQFRDEFRCAPDWHRFAFDNFIQLAAFHQAHAEVAATAALTDFMNRNDEWMVQAGGSFCLEAKALELRFRGSHVCGTEANDL